MVKALLIGMAASALLATASCASGGAAVMASAPPEAVSAPAARPPEPPAQLSNALARMHFVWALPPGVHEMPPWNVTVLLKVHGEVKHEALIQLRSEHLAPGSRSEFPGGYEIVRLTSDPAWAEQVSELDRLSHDLVEQYGPGNGEIELQSKAYISIDETHRRAFCVDRQIPDMRLYVEQEGSPELTHIVDGVDTLAIEAVRTACRRLGNDT